MKYEALWAVAALVAIVFAITAARANFGKERGWWHCRWYRGAVATLISVFLVYPLSAQGMPERLTHAYALEREGKPAQAIDELQALLNAKYLDASGTGKAWNVLGLAYQDEGDYIDSQHAYERSVQMFGSLPDNAEDYAMVLNDFGGLYVETSQPKLAFKLREKALRLYEKMADHAGMTRVSTNLAGLAFTQKKIDEGRAYLERATREAGIANDLDDDDRAAVASMQGWLAQLNRDLPMSVSKYRESLELLIKRHGEEHPVVGWGYMLLGNAYEKIGDLTAALGEMNRGRSILSRTMDSQNPKYLTAELAYSRILDATGAHLEAVRIKTDAERRLKEEYSHRCSNCTISAAVFQ